MRRSTAGRTTDPERLWQEEKKHLKTVGNWLRVKALSLDQFHIIKQLGTGFYGPIRLVKHKGTGNLYTLKAFHHTGKPEDQQVINRLNNERTLLMETNSVWVERMFHSVQDAHFHFVLLEYIPGGSLAQLIRQEGNLQENQARFYGAEMLMGINAIHRNGFMHRNIQPSSFLIDHFGHVKIVDFGTSLRFLPAETCVKLAVEASMKDGKPYLSGERRDRVQIYQRKTGDTTVGPVEFMAPEVVRKRPTGLLSYIKPVDPATMYSFAADFWSFGVCVYCMLFGELPFVGKDQNEVSHKIVNWRKNLTFPIVQPISDEAKDLIKKLLCDEPYRLGLYGCEDVMSHVFFDSIDWLRLRDLPVSVPYRSQTEESSDSSDPPAFIAHLLQAGNRASNNRKLSEFFEPYLEDRLQTGMDRVTSVPALPAVTRRVFSEPPSSNRLVESRENRGARFSAPCLPPPLVTPLSVRSSTMEIPEAAQERPQLLRGWSFDLSRLSPAPSTSQGRPSLRSGSSQPLSSSAVLEVSWDEQSPEFFNREDIQRWLQSGKLSARPARGNVEQVPPSVAASLVDSALRRMSIDDIRRLSQEKRKLKIAKRNNRQSLPDNVNFLRVGLAVEKRVSTMI